ncbi:MAG: methyltransferase domain-containing protein [Desulfobaccales bacterium]
MNPYSNDFYENRVKYTLDSAKEIIPIIIGLIKPKSVVDVGCGTGEWLSIFKQYGVTTVLGIDGDYVTPKNLKISDQEFLPFDLKKPLRLERESDLVISVEVAEHLPPECAEMFIESLTRLGPIILFSAAIPFQSGLHHLNEQWPDYWEELFRKQNYQVIDCIRKKIWQNANVAYYYAQNMLLFVKKDLINKYPQLAEELRQNESNILSIVHPKSYLLKADIRNHPSLKIILLSLPALIIRSLKERGIRLVKWFKRAFFNT